MKIKNKISWPVSLLVSLLMTVLTLFGYQYLAHVAKQEVSQEYVSLLNLAAKYIDEDVVLAREILELAAGGIDPALLKEPERLRARLDQVKGGRAFFDGGFEIIDADRRILAQSPPSSTAAELTQRRYVAMALAVGKPTMSGPYRSPLPPHHPVVSFSTPIRDAGGNVVGLFLGHHDLLRDNTTNAMLQKIGERSRLILLQRDRTVLRHSDPSMVLQQIPPGKDTALDDALQRNRLGLGETTDAGKERWNTAAIPLKNAEWILAVQYPESEAYRPLTKARQFFAGALLLILAVTQLTLRRLVQRVMEPLLRLVRHVRDLPGKEGDERSISISTGDELEHLALSVNAMVSEMDKKREVLEENHELYRIIADFTSEMAILRNLDCSIRYVSPNCLALTGYTDRELVESPKLLESLIHPQDLQALKERCGSGFGPPAPGVDLRLVTRGGETRWFRYTCRRVTGSDGEYVGVRGSFRDITQDRHLERMLEEERGFFESLLENTSTPLFVIDRNHRVVVWNRAMAEMTGMRSADMVGTDRHWEPFYNEKRPTLCDLVMSPELGEAAKYYKTYSNDVVMKGMVRAEGWYRNLNGKDRYLFFDASPVIRDGETVAVVETLYDITERVLAQESLRLFSRAVDQSASIIVITDAKGTIQYVNRKFSEVSGYPREEVVGRKPSILKSGKQDEEVYRELWKTIAAGQEWHGEFYNKKKNGTFFWESALISPVCDQEGRVTHFLGIKEEITARKDAERQLLKSQAEMVLKHEQLTELFRQVEKGKREWEQTMDCIDAMVAMVDASGYVRRCNRAFRRMAGKSFQSLHSSKWRDILINAGLNLQHLEGESGELFHEPTKRWLTLRIYPYGEHEGAVIMLHDLTEIKTVSEQLAAAYEELKATHSQLLQQEKMASIGQLAAGVAHEINNPMGFISSNLGTMVKYLGRLEGFLELQSAAVDEVAPERMKEEMAQARRSFKVDYVLGDARNLLAESQDGAERVRTIVQNLKSFSRVDDARASYVELNECLESTITIAWNELKYKTTLNRDYGELPPVKCLPQQLNQVFLNILVNAAHAIEKQGEITITTRHEGEEVTVAIHDTGSGIPEEIKNRIFEPFFTTKEVGKGTGLGLSISYDIIKKHNGSIEVESVPGKGTTFTVRLPVEGVPE